MHIFYLHGFASSARSSKARYFGERLAAYGVPLHCPDFNEPDFSTLTITRMLDQVDAAIDALPPGPVALIASSLGAFVAWHTTARRQRRKAAAAGAPADISANAAASADARGGVTGLDSAGTATRTGVPAAATADANVASRGTASGAAGAGHPIVKLVLLAPAFEFGANRLRALQADGLAQWKATDRLEFFHYGFNEPRAVHYALYEDSRQYESARANVAVPTLVFQGLRDASVDPDQVQSFAATRPSITLHLLDDDHQLLASLDRIWRDTAPFLDIPEP
jgi:pimeloyl-ACP methyl ester carboxylesterase